LVGVDKTEDLLAGGLDMSVGRIVDDPESTALRVLGFVLPMVTGQIVGDDEVEEEIERVDTEGSPPGRPDEIDIPVTAAVVPVEVPTDAEILASRVPNEQGGVPPSEAAQFPPTAGQLGYPLPAHSRIAAANPFDPGGGRHEHYPRPARNHECASIVRDHPAGAPSTRCRRGRLDAPPSIRSGTPSSGRLPRADRATNTGGCTGSHRVSGSHLPCRAWP